MPTKKIVLSSDPLLLTVLRNSFFQREGFEMVLVQDGQTGFQAGDRLELIGPAMRQSELTFAEATDKAGEIVTTVQPNALVQMALPEGTQPGDFLRRWR